MFSPLLSTCTPPVVAAPHTRGYVQMTPEAPGSNLPVRRRLCPDREPLCCETALHGIAAPNIRNTSVQTGTLLLRLLCIVLAVAATGCASLLRSPTPNELHITSEPDHIRVIVNGRLYTTPAIIELASAPRYVLEYAHTGYQTVRDTVEASVGTGWLIADILCSLPAFGIPVAFDALFGQWYVIDEESERLHIILQPAPPGTPSHLPAALADHSSSTEKYERAALLLETGFALPIYQTPIVPTSYSAGFSVAPAHWCSIALRQEVHGSAAVASMPDTAGVFVPTETSLFILSTALDLRIPLWNTGLYLAGGAGAMHASVGYGESTVAVGWLPYASAGGGYLFSGGKWFADARYTSALSGMRTTSPDTFYRPAYTTVRVGLRLLLTKE